MKTHKQYTELLIKIYGPAGYDMFSKTSEVSNRLEKFTVRYRNSKAVI